MKQLYRAAGTIDRDFVGQITYTVCLERPLRELDIEFRFDKQRFSEADVTPELVRETAALIRESTVWTDRRRTSAASSSTT